MRYVIIAYSYVCILYRNVITLSTTPAAPDTHWKQTVCWLDPINRIQSFSSLDKIIGRVTYQRRLSNLRDYDIIIEWKVVRDGGESLTDAHSDCRTFSHKQLFCLSS